MRTRVVVTLALVAATATALPTRADAGPIRSGRIISGTAWFINGCETAAECRAWLTSGCNPALTGRNPALTASIEDVSRFADGRTRRTFRHHVAEPAGLRWGKLVVQFWRADCTEIHGTYWRSWDPDTGRDRQSLTIPRGARWMSVSSMPDNVNVAWTLS